MVVRVPDNFVIAHPSLLSDRRHSHGASAARSTVTEIATTPRTSSIKIAAIIAAPHRRNGRQTFRDFFRDFLFQFGTFVADSCRFWRPWLTGGTSRNPHFMGFSAR